MVMGGDSCSKRCGFESQCRMLDGHDIFHIDLLFEKTENKRKRGRDWLIFLKIYFFGLAKFDLKIRSVDYIIAIN